jgi:hypothetical protein
MSYRLSTRDVRILCAAARITVNNVLYTALQNINAENLKQIFPRKRSCAATVPSFHIHVSVSNLYILTIDLPILLQENMWTDPGNIDKSVTDTSHMNVAIGTEAAQIPEKEYINGIFGAVCTNTNSFP